MKYNNEKLIEILTKENYVTNDDVLRAKTFADENHTDPIDFLLGENLIDKNTILQALAESYKLPLVDLLEENPAKELVQKIPQEFANEYRIILFSEGKEWKIATDTPGDKNWLGEIAKKLNKKKIKVYFADTEQIESVMTQYKKSLDTRFAKIINEEKRIAPGIIDEIIDDALVFKASDIHFEPQERDIIVRFRVDGVLQEAGKIPKEYYDNIVNRIKVMAQLRIDEHFATQDGAIRIVRNDSNVDLRISIAPTLYGENVVIRLLTEYIKDLTLKELGISEDDQKTLLLAAKKPFGMILVSGPTGSGKSTTLYALIEHIKNQNINVTTIEDPVEYRILGATQIQVNEDKDITFAKGLRSIVRQDPDIILVGEIRDEETAEIAVNAALVGHLLFSTFHANDAATSIPRLINMGIEPFLLSSTLDLVISQRLVRNICSTCRISKEVTREEIESDYPGWGKYFDKKTTFFVGKGCENCNSTGYKGRIAIFEFMPVTKAIKGLILSNPSVEEIWEMAKKQGAHSLLEDGLSKVKNGFTTIEELARVVATNN